MNQICHVVVSVPAHNEQALLGPCLDSVQHAVALAQDFHADVRVETVVALDRCTDRTAEVATAHGVRVVKLERPGVGVARDAAIDAGLRSLGHPDPARTWLACTDADTVVPPAWLVRQLLWAGQDVDLVLGTVYPDSFADLRTRRIWGARHHLGEGHRHVHGANLGVRANRWQQVGGFGERTWAEDVALARAVQQLTTRWVATDSTRVSTSGRLQARAVGGFADYLNDIAAGTP